MLGKTLLWVALAMVLHAAYSVYEHLSYLKALGKPEGTLPQDTVVEVIAAMFIGILGASLNNSQLREITWRSEMKRRKMDEMDARPSFASYVHRGNSLFGVSK